MACFAENLARPFAADTPWLVEPAAWPVAERQPTIEIAAAIVVAWKAGTPPAIAAGSSSIELVAATSFAMSAS